MSIMSHSWRAVEMCFLIENKSRLPVRFTQLSSAIVQEGDGASAIRSTAEICYYNQFILMPPNEAF